MWTEKIMSNIFKTQTINRSSGMKSVIGYVYTMHTSVVHVGSKSSGIKSVIGYVYTMHTSVVHVESKSSGMKSVIGYVYTMHTSGTWDPSHQA